MSASTTPWIEKYRPRKISDVVHQEEVTQALQRSLGNENLPHLLFYGPPGTGKTSTILAAGKQLFGPEFYKSRVLELNASDERGINVIRSKVKEFAQLAVSSKPAPNSKYPVPPFKLIILDEADSMTRDAQAALRRTMEVYSKVTRFCLICNYVSRIIEPVASRCAKFRFKALDRDLMMDRLKYIAEQELLTVEEGTFQTICEVSNGDLRRGITILQSTYRMYDHINSENVREVAGLIPQEEITKFYRASANAQDFRSMQQLCKSYIRNAYPASQFIEQLHDEIAQSSTLNNIQKAKICIQLAQTEKALIDGADEYLQLMNLGAFIIRTCAVTKS